MPKYAQFTQERGSHPMQDIKCIWTGTKNASKWGIYQQNLAGVFGDLATLAPGQVVPEIPYDNIKDNIWPYFWNLWNFLWTMQPFVCPDSAFL